MELIFLLSLLTNQIFNGHKNSQFSNWIITTGRYLQLTTDPIITTTYSFSAAKLDDALF